MSVGVRHRGGPRIGVVGIAISLLRSNRGLIGRRLLFSAFALAWTGASLVVNMLGLLRRNERWSGGILGENFRGEGVRRGKGVGTVVCK